MTSALASRFKEADVAAFAAAYPHPWVVWEPGPWAPPGNVATQTMVMAKAVSPGKLGGEALAMALKLAGGQASLILGRGESVDLPINDATLSRSHLAFAPGLFGQWTVIDQGSRNGTWLDARKLTSSIPEPLRDGAQVQAGQVYLTFYEAAGLFARLYPLRQR